jgi:hypothetical protein
LDRGKLQDVNLQPGQMIRTSIRTAHAMEFKEPTPQRILWKDPQHPNLPALPSRLSKNGQIVARLLPGKTYTVYLASDKEGVLLGEAQVPDQAAPVADLPPLTISAETWKKRRPLEEMGVQPLF